MDNSELAKEWFDIAETDLSSAKHLLTMQRFEQSMFRI